MSDTTAAAAAPSKRAPSRLLVVLMLVALFGAGMVAGVTLDRLVLHHRHGPFAGMGPSGAPGRGSPEERAARRADMHRRLADRMSRELGLSPEQRQQLDAMLPRHEAAFDSLRAEMDVRLRTLLDSTGAEVERILTPDQKTKWEAVRRRFREPGPPPLPESRRPPVP